MGAREREAGGDAVIYEWPSITTFFVIAHLVSSRFFHRPLLDDFERRVLFLTLAVLGIVLTTTTIGRPAANVYGLGFSGFAPLVCALIAANIARRAPSLALLSLIVIVAFDVHLFRSRNLFDYAIDPFIALASWFWSLGALWRFGFAGRRSAEADAEN